MCVSAVLWNLCKRLDLRALQWQVGMAILVGATLSLLFSWVITLSIFWTQGSEWGNVLGVSAPRMTLRMVKRSMSIGVWGKYWMRFQHLMIWTHKFLCMCVVMQESNLWCSHSERISLTQISTNLSHQMCSINYTEVSSSISLFEWRVPLVRLKLMHCLSSSLPTIISTCSWMVPLHYLSSVEPNTVKNANWFLAWWWIFVYPMVWTHCVWFVLSMLYLTFSTWLNIMYTHLQP